MKTLEEMAEEYAAINGWISVKDKLPEIGAVVLAGKVIGTFWGVAIYNGVFEGKWPSLQLQVSKCTYEHAGWSDEITHWMPLPERPKEEE
jgi:hypothetical protein